jgi:diacylglycerol kinase family enzyme
MLICTDVLLGRQPEPLWLLGGDLATSIGSRDAGASRDGDRRAMLLPCDAIEVRLDDAEPTIAVAHVVVRRSGRFGWWRGRVVAFMNAEWFGAWDVTPRSHPNDGSVELVTADASLSLRARWQIRGRLASGTHLPHPGLSVTKVTSHTVDVAPGEQVWLDGIKTRGVRQVSIELRPDSWTIAV